MFRIFLSEFTAEIKLFSEPYRLKGRQDKGRNSLTITPALQWSLNISSLCLVSVANIYDY